MSMTFLEIKQLVKAEVSVDKRKIYRAINRAIRRINGMFIGYLDTERAITVGNIESSLTLTFAASGKTITDDDGGSFVTMGFAAGDKIYFAGDSAGALNVTEMTIASFTTVAATNDTIVVTETIVNDAAIAGTLGVFTVDSNYTWNFDSKKLTVPNYVKEVTEVFENTVQLVPRDLEYVSDTDYDDETCYAMISDNVIKFPSWLMEAEDDYADIEMIRNIPLITTDTDVTVVYVQSRMENMLLAGIFFDIYSSKDEKDVDLAKINFDDFNNSISNYNAEEVRRVPTKQRELKYKY